MRRLFPVWAAFSLLLTLYAVPSATAGTVTYTYDDAGRLVVADYGNGTQITRITWTYDKNGNLLKREVTSGTTPVPDVRANLSDGPLTVTSGTPVSITVNFNPNIYSGQNADWWVAELAPSGTFNYYDLSTGSMVPGLLPTHQGPLFSLGTTQLLNSSDLTMGTHIFYFGVDLNMNGSLDMNSIYYDSVGINVTGP